MKFLVKKPNHLSHKFVGGVILILLFTMIATVFVNSKIAGRLYRYEQREYVRKIGVQLETELQSGTTPGEAIQKIEEREKVLITYSEKITYSENEKDYYDLVYEISESFKEKGLGFQNYWLWDQDYEDTLKNGTQIRWYSQQKLNYSILVEYLSVDSKLYAIATIVPTAQDFIEIINRSGFLIYSISALVSIVLIFFLTKHITKPLEQVREFTKKISRHEYQTLEIKTGDELEDVANSLNDMARDIEQYQKMLQEKNEQMKQLLSDVAHDLKTPISLVGMYAAGIKDGLDDGTFLDTIIRHDDKMSKIVEKLLHLSRIEQKEHPCEKLLLDDLLIQCIEEQKVLFDQRNLEVRENIQSGLIFDGNRELLNELFSNLLSNAAKYAALGCVKVELVKRDQAYFFCIANNTDNIDLDTSMIWQPFYVGEDSRNKELSGTGLGLSIVKKIADQFYYSISCNQNGHDISFEIVFPVKEGC